MSWQDELPGKQKPTWPFILSLFAVFAPPLSRKDPEQEDRGRAMFKVETLLVTSHTRTAPFIREALKKIRPKSELHIVRDGAEAMEFLHRAGRHEDAPRPDLLFLELNRPQERDWEFLSLLRRDKQFRVLPVVVLSDSKNTDDIAKAYHLGANAFHSTHANEAELQQVIQSLTTFWFDMAALPPKR